MPQIFPKYAANSKKLIDPYGLGVMPDTYFKIGGVDSWEPVQDGPIFEALA